MEHNRGSVYRKVRECLWILPKGNKNGRESEEGAFHESGNYPVSCDVADGYTLACCNTHQE